MTKHLLLAENDLDLCASLQSLFQSQGWKVTSTSSLKGGYRLIGGYHFDLALIDRLLDDGDGLELVAYLRESSPQTRSICLTTLGQVQEKIKGLRLGADDYLPKPFATQELLLRVDRLMSLERITIETVWTHSHFSFHPLRGQIVQDQGITHLPKRETQILSLLFRHQNQVVTRQMLLDTLWPSEAEIPLDSTLDVYIRRLRMKLKQPGIIKTFRGFGYKLVT